MRPTEHLQSTGVAESSPPLRRLLLWVVLSILAATLVWFGFRGYLNPELLYHFSSQLYC